VYVFGVRVPAHIRMEGLRLHRICRRLLTETTHLWNHFSVKSLQRRWFQRRVTDSKDADSKDASLQCLQSVCVLKTLAAGTLRNLRAGASMSSVCKRLLTEKTRLWNHPGKLCWRRSYLVDALPSSGRPSCQQMHAGGACDTGWRKRIGCLK